MTVASTVEVYDPEECKLVWSKREYIEAVENLSYPVEVGSHYTHTETRRRSVYLDVESGLLVHDVSAFEKWIETL